MEFGVHTRVARLIHSMPEIIKLGLREGGEQFDPLGLTTNAVECNCMFKTSCGSGNRAFGIPDK